MAPAAHRTSRSRALWWARRLALSIGLGALLLTAPAEALKLIAVLPLDVTNTNGKLDKAAQVSLEESLRDLTTEVLRPSGWTILSSENMLQVLTDNGVDVTKCGQESCQLAAAREIKVSKFISGSVQYVDGEFTASIRLIDTRTGQILSSMMLSGQDALELRRKLRNRAAEFFSQAEVVGDGAVQEETTGELYLQANPPDATFQLDDGAPVDLVPGHNTVLTLALGPHHLVVRKKGLQDYQQDFLVQRGLPVTIKATLLAPPPPATSGGQSYLTVDSDPEGARIFLDGQDTGQVTPANFQGLAVGEHQVVLQHDLYLDWQKRLTLKPDDVQLIKPTLTSNFGSLTVTTEPPGATVYLNGEQQAGVTPLQFRRLEAKAFRLRLTLPQFETVGKTIVVQPGENTEVREALSPQFGTLVLRPKPDGATAYLDDVQLDQVTPITRERVALGPHRVRLTYPLYRTFEREILIERGKTTVVDDALIPTTGGLIVSAQAEGQDLAGADVYVNGEKRGQTPLTLDAVSEGSVELEVRSPLYRSWSGKAIVVAQQQVRVEASLAPQFGLVEATSTPPGTLTVDGAPLGPADGRSYQVGMGSHHVTIVPDDPGRYRPYERTALIEVGRTVKLEATLVPKLGNLVVQTVPPGVSITLDDQDQGTSPRKLANLFAGKHTLRLSLERYLDWSRDVNVEDGKTEVVEATLRSVDLIKYDAEIRQRKLVRMGWTGSLTGVFALASGVSLFFAHGYAGTEHDAVASYNAATDPTAAAVERTRALSAFSSARTSQVVSVAAGAAAVGTLIWLIYDAATLPPAHEGADQAQ